MTVLTRHQPWILAGLGAALLLLALTVLLAHIWDTRRLDEGLSVLTEDANLLSNSPAGELGPKLAVSQSFRADQDMLQEVGVHVATYGQANTATLFFSLREYPLATQPIRTATAEGASLQDNAYYSFRFPPIRLSAGKHYIFTLESPEAKGATPITVWVGECDCYPGGAFFLNGEEQDRRDLAFRLGYDRHANSALGELLDRMSQYKPWFFKGAFLASLGILSLALVVLAVGSFVYGLEPSAGRSLNGPWILALGLAVLALTLVLVVR